MARRRSLEQLTVSKRVQEEFGKRLQAQRKGRRSQHELAAALDVTRTTISNIERGRHRIFLDQAYLAANALGIPLSDLLPALEHAFPIVGVALEVGAEVKQTSIVRVSEIVTTLQQSTVSERTATADRSAPAPRRK